MTDRQTGVVLGMLSHPKKLQIFHMLGGVGGQPTYGKFHMFFCRYFLKASLLRVKFNFQYIDEKLSLWFSIARCHCILLQQKILVMSHVNSRRTF